VVHVQSSDRARRRRIRSPHDVHWCRGQNPSERTVPSDERPSRGGIPVSAIVIYAIHQATSTPDNAWPDRARCHQIYLAEEWTHVSGKRGALLEGVAGELGSDTLWVMTLADNGLVYVSNDTPIAITSDGHWSFLDQPIGAGASDVGSTFVMLAVRANTQCRETLQDAKPNDDGDVAFKHLPQPCVKADSLNIVKASP